MQHSPGQRIHYFFIGLLIVIYLVNGIVAIPKLSTNSDEAHYLNYAVRLLKGQPDKVRKDVDASCLPISVLNALPRAVQQVINPSLTRHDNGVLDITNGRYLTLLAGLFLGFYIYRWSKEWYGDTGALASLTAFVFCPNLGAYAASMMTDLYASLFTIVPLYHYWKYKDTGQRKQFLLFAATLGIAQISKQSLTHLYIIFFIIWTVPLLTRASKIGKWKELVGSILILIVIQLFVIGLAFQFRHFGKPLADYQLQSRTFVSLKNKIGPLAKIPLPLPEPYLKGIDENMYLVELGPGIKIAAGDNYLFEEKRRAVFPYYFLAVSFFKTPIVTLLAIIFSLILMIRHFNRSFWRNEFVLILPVIYYLAYFNLVLPIQGGLRFVLMIFPLLYVLCGRMAAEFKIQNSKVKSWRLSLALTALSWLIVSFYYYWPNLIPYTNEFIVDKKMAYRIMCDNNLDNGQANYFLAEFLSRNPAYREAPLRPTAGKFYIGLNELLDLFDEGKYEWLYSNFKPVAHVGHAFLLFDISKDQLLAKLGASE